MQHKDQRAANWDKSDKYFENCFRALNEMLEYLTPKEIKDYKLGDIQNILREVPKPPTQNDRDNDNFDALYPNISGDKNKLKRLQAAYVTWDKATKNGLEVRAEVLPVIEAIEVIGKFTKDEPHPFTPSREKLQFLQQKLVADGVQKPTPVTKSRSAPVGVSQRGMFGPDSKPAQPAHSQSEPTPPKKEWSGFGKKKI